MDANNKSIFKASFESGKEDESNRKKPRNICHRIKLLSHNQ